MKREASRGFTLIELMTTLAVLAVMITIGVPGLQHLLERAREAGAYHLLTTSLAGARMAAISKGVPVTVCPSLDGMHCRSDSVWESGWILFEDPGKTAHPRSPGAILQQVDGTHAGLTLRSTRGRQRVRFTPDGWAYGSNLSVRLCSVDEASLLGKVVVNTAGRPRTERVLQRPPCPH